MISIERYKNMDDFNLSIILPFYKKYYEFEKVIVKNHKFFERNGIEVIIVLDESGEKAILLNLIQKYPFINWIIVVNENVHEWRNPAKTINVGIRLSTKKYILVMSPESELYTDALSILMNTLIYYNNCFVVGRVYFASFDESYENVLLGPYRFWGSILAERQHLIEIGGYNEECINYGGDDVNLRARLEFYGISEIQVPEAILIHREFVGKTTRKIVAPQNYHEAFRSFYFVSSYKTNIGKQWGHDFNDVVYNYKTMNSESNFRSYIKEFISCQYERRIFNEKYKITALVQAHNEEHNINDALSHFAENSDAIILLDDGSNDMTFEAATNEKLILKIKKNRICFNDLENRNILLDLASFICSEWFYFIDIDERFDNNTPKVYDYIEQYKYDVLAFRFVHLWGNEDSFNAEYPYSEQGVQYKWRMFRNIGKMKIITRNRLHFQPIPYMTNPIKTNILLKHLSTLKEEDRRKKYDRYMTDDVERNQKSYFHLLKTNVKLRAVSELYENNNY